MRTIIVVVLAVLFLECREVPEKPVVEVAASAGGFEYHGSVLYRHGEPFSGIHVKVHTIGQVRSRTPYVDGRIHGLARGWYPDGAPQFARWYERGKKEGLHRGWWPDGALQFTYHFEADRHEGRAREWFADGTLYRDFHYKQGKEAGSQRMWREDGTLRANYVVRNGRRYGLIGEKPCSGKDR